MAGLIFLRVHLTTIVFIGATISLAAGLAIAISVYTNPLLEYGVLDSKVLSTPVIVELHYAERAFIGHVKGTFNGFYNERNTSCDNADLTDEYTIACERFDKLLGSITGPVESVVSKICQSSETVQCLQINQIYILRSAVNWLFSISTCTFVCTVLAFILTSCYMKKHYPSRLWAATNWLGGASGCMLVASSALCYSLRNILKSVVISQLPASYPYVLIIRDSAFSLLTTSVVAAGTGALLYHVIGLWHCNAYPVYHKICTTEEEVDQIEQVVEMAQRRPITVETRAASWDGVMTIRKDFLTNRSMHCHLTEAANLMKQPLDV